MHPLLHSWRDDLSATVVRLLAYVGAAAVLSVVAAQIFRAPRPVLTPAEPAAWTQIERPFPAFALSIPEAADVPAGYAIRRHAVGGGRKDILTLGEPDSTAPYFEVQIYRPGKEISRFAAPADEIAESAGSSLSPTDVQAHAPIDSKFGPLSIVTFKTTKGTARSCLGFVRAYDDPMLLISGWFCQGGDYIQTSTLACALDRLTLLAAGSEPKVGILFAKAELKRSFCGQHDPILASTPKYRLLWKALANRPEPRRVGR